MDTKGQGCTVGGYKGAGLHWWGIQRGRIALVGMHYWWMQKESGDALVVDTKRQDYTGGHALVFSVGYTG